MSIEKNMNTRIIHKHDIEANWEKAINFIPKQGEIIIYDIDANYNYERFKIGDGITTVNNLLFITSQADWNQNDEFALDYIKNKPEIATDEDALKLLGELNLVVPVTTLNNKIITDSTDRIYIL